ncbi:MAG: putative S-layer protein [Candidatus Pacearchaeota archaeon]
MQNKNLKFIFFAFILIFTLTAIFTFTSNLVNAFDYCDANSTSNYLTVSIYNEDNFRGKDFKPYDKLNIEVKVTNNDNKDHDIVVEAILVDGNETIEDTKVKNELEVNEESYKKITLTIEIPVIEEKTYDVYVKAYDDRNETECVQDSSYIDIDRPTRELRILNALLDKSSYSCSESLILSGVIANIGTNDENQVKLVYSDDLGNSFENFYYDLYEGDEINFMFTASIPANASERQHIATLKVYYDYRNGNYNRIDTYNYYFTVSGGCIKPVKDVSLSMNINSELMANETYQGILLLSNTGNLDATYIIEINPDWAIVNLETGLVSLNVGESKAVSFTIKPTKEGNFMLIAKAKFDGKEKSITKSVSVSRAVSSYESYDEGKYRKASWWDEVKFEFARRPWALAIVIGSLIIAIVCLIGMIVILRSSF